MTWLSLDCVRVKHELRHNSVAVVFSFENTWAHLIYNQSEELVILSMGKLLFSSMPVSAKISQCTCALARVLLTVQAERVPSAEN